MHFENVQNKELKEKPPAHPNCVKRGTLENKQGLGRNRASAKLYVIAMTPQLQGITQTTSHVQDYWIYGYLDKLLRLPPPLVDDGAAGDVEESAAALAGHRARQHRLPSAWGTMEQHSSPRLQETSKHFWIPRYLF